NHFYYLFLNATPPSAIYTLSLHDALPIYGTITTIPYSVETNDIVIHALQHLPSEQFLKRCTDQFDRLYLEGADNARIMAISIHQIGKHTSELQSLRHLVCRLLLEKKK